MTSDYTTCYHRCVSRPAVSVMPVDQSPSLETLIQRCLGGDQTAWDLIVKQHWRKVFNVAYKFVGRHDEAEDLTQDIFVKVFRSLGTFDRRANFQTWLISISRNLCIDHYRSVRRERETVDRNIESTELAHASPDPGPMAGLEQRDRVTLLRQALSALQPALRTAVILRDLQELSYQEIADQLRLPEGTVKSRINRGRTELARQVRQLLDEQFTTGGSSVDRRPGTGAY
jgi:RNA polymerase sigma-70 factor (ECF subfamily)